LAEQPLPVAAAAGIAVNAPDSPLMQTLMTSSLVRSLIPGACSGVLYEIRDFFGNSGEKLKPEDVAHVYSSTMLKRYWLVLTIPFLLAACAPSEQQRADYAAVQSAGVSPAVYDKMVHGDSLSISDVAALSQARVNDGIIVRYIRDHGTVYMLGPQDIAYLQRSGVSPSVVDYMVQTGQNGGGAPIPISIGIGLGGGGYYGGGHWR